jgi:hypothetical protein
LDAAMNAPPRHGEERRLMPEFDIEVPVGKCEEKQKTFGQWARASPGPKRDA